MKKSVCLLLVAAMCLGLSGCGMGLWFLGMFKNQNISEGEKRAALEHLEKKYGEKFVIERIVVPENEGSSMRGLRVHPEGKEGDSFFVSINPTYGTIIDEYAVLLNERRMIPIYEEWICGVIPSAKVSIYVSGSPSHDMPYNPKQSLQEFVTEAEGLSIDVNIVLSEDMLENKDDIFEKLSKLPESEPISGYSSGGYRIAFYMQDAFDSINSGDDMYMFLDPTYGKDVVAVTDFGQSYHMNTPQQWGFLEQLYDKFETKEDVE